MNKLRILFYKQHDNWIAQCLEVDLAAQGKTIEDARYFFERALFGELTAFGPEHLNELAPAPKEFWARWEAGSRLVETGSMPFRAPGRAAVSPPSERESRVA